MEEIINYLAWSICFVYFVGSCLVIYAGLKIGKCDFKKGLEDEKEY